LRWLLQPDDDRFAHPAEIEFARLLTFYGIRWAYEPTTFAVRWGRDGQPEEFVTPDFYLPDHGLYVELTTMRQRLVTRKNRKFRLLRHHYPNIRVKILYLRDFERLREAFGRRGNEGDARVGEPLYGERDVAARVAGLAGEVVETWLARGELAAGVRPLLLGVGAGCERFLSTLAESVRAEGVGVDVSRVDLTAYPGPGGPPRARVTRLPPVPLAGRSVLVVQEVLSTGLTAAFLEPWLRRNGAANVEVCALLDRQAARILDVPLLSRGFDAPDVALAGFGLSRWRAYRHLPFIAEIEIG
jgi:hypoxanthine phosphoribosyltransferase